MWNVLFVSRWFSGWVQQILNEGTENADSWGRELSSVPEQSSFPFRARNGKLAQVCVLRKWWSIYLFIINWVRSFKDRCLAEAAKIRKGQEGIFTFPGLCSDRWLLLPGLPCSLASVCGRSSVDGKAKSRRHGCLLWDIRRQWGLKCMCPNGPGALSQEGLVVAVLWV